MAEDLKKKTYPHLKGMSTEALEELLRQDFYASDEMDLDYTMAILEVIEENKREQPTGELFDVDAAWEAIMQRCRDESPDPADLKVLREDTPVTPCKEDSTKPTKPKRIGSWRKSWIFRVAAAVAVIYILLGPIPQVAFGFNLWQAIASFTESVFGFGKLSDEKPPLDREYASAQDALDGLGIEERVIPPRYPEGYAETEVTVLPLPGRVKVHTIVERGESSFTISVVIYETRPSESDQSRTHQMGSEVLQYKRGGITHSISQNEGNMVAIWFNGNLECTIQGDISESDLEAMIDSIY